MLKKATFHSKSDYCEYQEADVGFPYIESFCQAIEIYTGSIEYFNPKAFEYRGAYLRYAIERYLYFFFLHNARLNESFREWISGEDPAINRTLSGVERNLALCLCGAKLKREDLSRGFSQRMNFNSGAFYLRSLMWKFTYASYAQFFRKSYLKSEIGADILIYVPAEKFFGYLSKITKALPFSFSYLVDISNSDMVCFLIKQKLPYIDSSKIRLNIERKYLNTLPKELSEFRSLFYWYDTLHGVLSSIRPRCVVVAEGNAPGDELINQACKQLAIPVICLQHGWSFIVHNGFRNMTYTKMLTWGKGFSDLLQVYNPKQNFVVVGNHSIDQEVTVLNKGSFFDSNAVVFFLQVPSMLITQECWNEFFGLIVWTAAEFANVPVLVREFPVRPLTKRLRRELECYSNVRLVSRRIYPLSEVLQQSQIAISICSSTILESIASGVLPIVFNMTTMPRFFPDVEAVGAGLEVKTPQEARDAISRCLNDNNYRKQFVPGIKSFQEKYFYKNDGNAYQRITQEIVSTVKD